MNKEVPLSSKVTHPSYLGWQVDWPVFVKMPFTAGGFNWKRGSHFPWAERGMDEKTVATLYASGLIYHNKQLEKDNKIGDRLSEMNFTQLQSLVTQMNAIIKPKTTSAEEYRVKRCKQSKLEDKQRGLIRRFLNNTPWIRDDFYRIRDNILGE